MNKKGILGIVILIVVVSGAVYIYMDYQKAEWQRRQQQRQYEDWLKEEEARLQPWYEEVAYYEKLAEENDWLYINYELVFSDGSTENMVDWVLKNERITDVLNCSRQQMLHEMEYYMSTGGETERPTRINLCIDKTTEVIYFLQVYQYIDMYDQFITKIVFTYWSQMVNIH